MKTKKDKIDDDLSKNLKQKQIIEGAEENKGNSITDAYIKTLGLKTKSNTKNILQKGILINRNNLNFVSINGEFFCKELFEIPKLFEAKYGKNPEIIKSVEEDIESYIQSAKKEIESRKTDDDDTHSEEERKTLGAQIFDEEIEKLKKKVENFSLFQKMMFWMSHYWWYYNPSLREKINLSNPDRNKTEEIIKKYLIPILPAEVQKEIQDLRIVNTAIGFGHFAILFDKDHSRLRRIITDTQLFEIKDVFGYSYLDITPNGKPVARSKTNRNGERAFFDGERLMSHDNFQTCAPKTVIVNGGYKVNSTHCTIVNGMLCDLIDEDDKVAHTNGAECFLGISHCDFTTKDALEALKLSEESGGQMVIRNNKIFLGGKEIKPIGYFEKSKVKLQDNGFSLYDWSEFYEISSYKYSDVLAIDDKGDFLKGLKENFSEIEKFKTTQTSSKEEALESILKNNPQVILLDMHLTPDESFEGLWIANQLVAKGYKGKIMITSGYGEEHLKAMRKLIKTNGVHIPGKDPEKIKECLTGKCRC
ncbi:response regulator [Candidatus Gracilibacteria bacterium]|nr:response regulator [Candidatus Gracilibacteria bacterium]